MGKSKYSEGATASDKKHFASYLAEDEELVVATGFGKNYMRHRFVYYFLFPGGVFLAGAAIYAYFTDSNMGYALLIGLVLATIAALLKSLWTYHANRYLLTTRRVMIKRGFFAVKLISALYDKITHIEVQQGIIDRMVMKHGSIIINTAGANKDELRIFYVDNPIEFKNLLERLINRQREHMGRSTGTVVTLEGELVEEK